MVMGIQDKKKMRDPLSTHLIPEQASYRSQRLKPIRAVVVYAHLVGDQRSLISFSIQQYCTIHDPTPNFSAARARSMGLLHRDSGKNEDRNCSSRRRLRSGRCW